MTKRVLHIFGQMNRGGAELRTFALISPLKDKDIHFDFCVLSGQVGVLDNDINQAGGKVYYCPLNITFPYRFFRLLINEKYDCVHSHVAMVSGVILFISWLARIKQRIAHFRNTHDSSSKSKIRKLRNKFLQSLINLFATDIAAVCKGALDIFWSKNWQKDKRCQVIYNGFSVPNLDVNNSLDLLEKKFIHKLPVAINIARMAPQKNHLFMIDILANAIKNDTPFYLVLIGKELPEIKEQVISKAKGFNCLEYIVFEGEQPNVYSYIQRADVLLFPSLWEGLPGAVVESASYGLPVVASALPGINEIAEQLPNIICIPDNSPIEEWSKAIKKHLNVTEAERINARMAFKDSSFSIDKCISAFHALYQQQ